MSLLVITPSRGRPAQAADCYKTFCDTRGLPDTEMLFVVDRDDPTLAEYNKAVPTATFEHSGGGMAAPLNAAVAKLASHYDVIGFVGDDHRFRTPGWDTAFARILTDKGGFAFGNDLARHDIPTQVFISSNILQALGWMCLPGAKHLYLDNTWRELGVRANCLYYFPDVIVEHIHPFYGKGQMDEGYQRVNAPSMYNHDRMVFEQWLIDGVDQDVATVKEAIRENQTRPSAV